MLTWLLPFSVLAPFNFITSFVSFCCICSLDRFFPRLIGSLWRNSSLIFVLNELSVLLKERRFDGWMIVNIDSLILRRPWKIDTVMTFAFWSVRLWLFDSWVSSCSAVFQSWAGLTQVWCACVILFPCFIMTIGRWFTSISAGPVHRPV